MRQGVGGYGLTLLDLDDLLDEGWQHSIIMYSMPVEFQVYREI